MDSRSSVVLFIVALLLAGCAEKPPRPAEGIFLAEGGVGYVELRKALGTSGVGQLLGGRMGRRAAPGGDCADPDDRLGRRSSGVDLIPGSEEGDWTLAAMDHGAKSSEAKLRPLATPVPSWLHLLNDERVIRYFEILDATGERTAPSWSGWGNWPVV
jgi:hypothetical protein